MKDSQGNAAIEPVKHEVIVKAVRELIDRIRNLDQVSQSLEDLKVKIEGSPIAPPGDRKEATYGDLPLAELLETLPVALHELSDSISQKAEDMHCQINDIRSKLF